MPEIDFDVPGTLVRALRGIGVLPPVRRSDFDTRQSQVIAALGRLESLGKVVIYPHRALCDAAACTVADGIRPLYIDDDHLSPFGSARVMPLFRQVLTP
ncbi:MAG: SGNH hydrolase domain-containing protein [Hyphomicrobiaceae bacterium]